MTGVEIDVPVEEEAGCLGAAIQAIWAYGRASGAGEDIAAIADRCVALDADKTIALSPAASRLRRCLRALPGTARPDSRRELRAWRGHAQNNVLEVKHISKSFPGVLALDDVSFSVKAIRFTCCVARTAPANQR